MYDWIFVSRLIGLFKIASRIISREMMCDKILIVLEKCLVGSSSSSSSSVSVDISSNNNNDSSRNTEEITEKNQDIFQSSGSLNGSLLAVLSGQVI